MRCGVVAMVADGGPPPRLPVRVENDVTVHALGALYVGARDDPVAREYWSDRGRGAPTVAPSSPAYPIPVGYTAVKVYRGQAFDMRTEAGPRGPLYVVAARGQPSGGEHVAESAHRAWQQCILANCDLEERPPVVDGRAFFGFTSPRVQALLRRLLPDATASSLPPPPPSLPPGDNDPLPASGVSYYDVVVAAAAKRARVGAGGTSPPRRYSRPWAPTDRGRLTPSAGASDRPAFGGGGVPLQAGAPAGSWPARRHTLPTPPLWARQAASASDAPPPPWVELPALNGDRPPAPASPSSEPISIPPPVVSPVLSSPPSSLGAAPRSSYSDGTGLYPVSGPGGKGLGATSWTWPTQTAPPLPLTRCLTPDPGMAVPPPPASATPQPLGTSGGHSPPEPAGLGARLSAALSAARMRPTASTPSPVTDAAQPGLGRYTSTITNDDPKGLDKAARPGSGEDTTIAAIRAHIMAGRPAEAVAVIDRLSPIGHGPPSVATLAALVPGKPDMWQLAAIRHAHTGSSVLLCGPPGIGKWAVAVAALVAARGRGGRVAVVVPHRALARQRYRALSSLLGAGSVGALWGWDAPPSDAAPPSAQVIVAALEPFRQSLYAAAAAAHGVSLGRAESSLASSIDGITLIIYDAVHTLADRKRGTMWEEALLWAPPGVQLLALSALWRNADLAHAWLAAARAAAGGPPVHCVVCKSPAVPTRVYYLKPGAMQLIEPARVSPAFESESSTVSAPGFGSPTAPTLATALAAGGLRTTGDTKRPSLRYILWQLHEKFLLPAVFYIFSRAACSQAVLEAATAQAQTGRAGLPPLLSPAEVARVRAKLDAFSEAYPGHLRPGDGSALEAGIAAHHAGLLPAWRDLVEECVDEGLVPLLFATETAASSMRVAARTAVLSATAKMHNGELRPVQPSELKQLVWRVGRRGVDATGAVVVLQSPHAPVAAATAITALPELRLFSRYQPNYGTVLHALRAAPVGRLRALIGRNFADFAASAMLSAADGLPRVGRDGVPPSSGLGDSGDSPATRGGLCFAGSRGGLAALERTAAVAASALRAAQESVASASRAHAATALRTAPALSIVSYLAPGGGDHPGVLLASVAGSGSFESHYVILGRDNGWRMLPARSITAVHTALPPLRLEAMGLTPPPLPLPAQWRPRAGAGVNGATVPPAAAGFEADGGPASAVIAALVPDRPRAMDTTPRGVALRSRLAAAISNATTAAGRLAAARAAATAAAGRGTLGDAAAWDGSAFGVAVAAEVTPVTQSVEREPWAGPGPGMRRGATAWADADRVIRVLLEAGALTLMPHGHLSLTPLGRTAAALQVENELWAAQVLESGALAGLSPSHLAAALSSVTTAPQGSQLGRRGGVWRPPTTPLPIPLTTALAELESMASALAALHAARGLRIVVIYDPGPVALVLAWATGAAWDELREHTTLDEGDICRALSRTRALLLQAAALDELEPRIRSAASDAVALISRFPVVNE